MSAMAPPPTVPHASASPQAPLRERSGDISADMAPEDRSRVNDESESASESESGLELESDEFGDIGQLWSGKRLKNRPSEHRKRRRRGPGEVTLETAAVSETSIGEGSGPREVRQLPMFHWRLVGSI